MHECRACDFDLCSRCKKGSVVRTSATWKAAKKRKMEAAAKAKANAATKERIAAKREKQATREAQKETRNLEQQKLRDERALAKKNKRAERAAAAPSSKSPGGISQAPLVPNCPGRHGLRCAVAPGDGRTTA